MNTHSPSPPGPGHGTLPAGGIVARTVRRYVKAPVAAAPTSPKPWYALPLAVVLSLIPIGFGGVVLYALWFLDAMPLRRPERAMNSFHALFILVVGVAVLFYAVKDRNRRVVRCPSCG